MSINRSVVESQNFTEERERFAPDACRFDEAMWVVDLRLSHDPESGTRLSRGGLYTTNIIFNDGRIFAIDYTFDDKAVVLESLRPERIPSGLERSWISEQEELKVAGETTLP